MKTFTKPGSNRKQCPECKIYVHDATGICVCGYELITGAKERKMKSKEHLLALYIFILSLWFLHAIKEFSLHGL